MSHSLVQKTEKSQKLFLLHSLIQFSAVVLQHQRAFYAVLECWLLLGSKRKSVQQQLSYHEFVGVVGRVFINTELLC